MSKLKSSAWGLSFLVYFPLSNLKLYLILVFVMFFYCSYSQFTENVQTKKYFFISILPKSATNPKFFSFKKIY